jgi:hypothetical protein
MTTLGDLVLIEVSKPNSTSFQSRASTTRASSTNSISTSLNVNRSGKDISLVMVCQVKRRFDRKETPAGKQALKEVS